jgi:hypothetical protein
MAQELPHSQLAAKLVVDGVLPYIEGNVQGQMPMPPIQLDDMKRHGLGLKPGGKTLFYALSHSGVFFDMNGSTAEVFYADEDYQQALGALDAALKRKYPNARQISDGPHPRERDYRLRAWEVPLGSLGRVALVEAFDPVKGGKSRKFIARVVAHTRKN